MPVQRGSRGRHSDVSLPRIHSCSAQPRDSLSRAIQTRLRPDTASKRRLYIPPCASGGAVQEWNSAHSQQFRNGSTQPSHGRRRSPRCLQISPANDETNTPISSGLPIHSLCCGECYAGATATLLSLALRLHFAASCRPSRKIPPAIVTMHYGFIFVGR